MLMIIFSQIQNKKPSYDALEYNINSTIAYTFGQRDKLFNEITIHITI